MCNLCVCDHILKKSLTLIYPAHFEDVPCQFGVNHIFEGKNDYVSRQVIYHCKEECLSFIKKQTEIQIYKFYASYTHEIDVKSWICHRYKRNEIQGAGKLGLKLHHDGGTFVYKILDCNGYWH